MSKVSIIVPVYNVEKYICRCVNSILGQTFQDFELILLDDGSPDRCPEICDRYAAQDARIKVLHLQNGGVSRARNAGLKVATGTYIAFCDSDDWWDENLLARVMTENEGGNWDWVSFRHRKVDDCGLTQEISHSVGQWIFENWDEKIQFLVSNFLQCRSGWEVWARLFKHDIIEQHEIRFCETCKNFAEDLGFCVKYLMCSDAITAIDACLYNYYLRDSSMMASSRHTIKLNELNEVSYDIGMFAESKLPKDIYYDNIGVFHYLIMNNQYQHVVFTEKYRTLPREFGRVERQKWFRKSAISTLHSKKNLQRFFGKEYANRILNFSFFCLHRNWYLYTMGRRLIDRKSKKLQE